MSISKLLTLEEANSLVPIHYKKNQENINPLKDEKYKDVEFLNLDTFTQLIQDQAQRNAIPKHLLMLTRCELD
jgi:CRISPR/Cas system CSM-associated protein Csm4 (group 5 of RAMP superfamily)